MKGVPNSEELCRCARELFVEKGYVCSEAVLAVMNDCLEDAESHLPEEYVKAAVGFGGGLGAGDACGALCGGIMAMSLLVAKTPGSETMEAKKARKALFKDFRDAFVARRGSVDCRDLTVRFESHDDPARKALCADIVEETVADLAERFEELMKKAGV